MTRAQAVAATSPMPLISTELKPFDVYELIDAETPERAAAKLARAHFWIQRRRATLTASLKPR